jgi:hypothetical protein
MTSDALSSARASVQQRVRTVARRARGLVCLYEISWFLATVGLAVLCLGLVDYLVRFQDVGVRLICFAVVWLVVAWGGFRYLFSAWRYRCSDLQAAQRIERRFPDLGDLLSNAIAFCAQAGTDEMAGSLELRRTVIAQAEVASEPLNFAACLDRRQPLRALLVAAAAIATMLVLGVANGPSAALAAKRLLVPWGTDYWPRRHVLEFVVAPTRLASGQDFEVELVDANGRLPDQVQIHYWFDRDEPAAIQTQAMQPLGQKLTHRLNSVTRGFRYRATGGDDQDMAWRELQVVEPARVLVQEMLLAPPGYTGLAARPATGNFRTLRGTRVALHVRVSKRLTSAALETDTTAGEQLIPLRLDPDRLGCALSHGDSPAWEISRSGSYGFRLVDLDAVDSGAQERWEVEAIPDTPPTVSLKQPAADLFLTARATVLIEAIVKDDLAIHSVALHFARSAQAEGGQQVVALWNGPDQVTPESENVARGEDEGVQRTVRYDWDLSLLPGLAPGAVIDFRLVASDYQPQEGPSAGRRITIISAEEHEERVVQRQAEILAQIAEVARLQQQTHGQTKQLEIPLREVGAISRDDVDLLQGAELNQRQVQQRLGHPSDGIQSQVVELIREIESNRLDSPAAMNRLGQLRDGIGALNENALSRIEHRMLDALKLAREDLGTRSENHATDAARLREPLLQLVRDVTADQEEVVRSLELMLGQLSQWDSYRRLATEVGRLRREQEDVRQRTDALRRETLSKDVPDLTDAQRVVLFRLTEQQNDIALRFDALQGRMDVTRQKLAADDPLAAATLVDAMAMVQRAGVGGGMRDAARKMETNRLSQASEQQDEVIRRLGELQDILANRRQDTQENLRYERLGRLLQAVTELLDRQQRLANETRQFDQASQTADGATPADRSDAIQRLAAEQATLGQDAGALQGTVMDIESFAMALRDAGSAAAQAAQKMQQQDTGAVTRGHQQEVLDTLTRMLEVLRDDQTPPREPDSAQQNPPPTPPQDDRPVNNQFLLVQLKLIRAMQQELNGRTSVLDQASKDAEGWSEQRVRQQQELTSRQGALADLLLQLLNQDAGDGPSPAVAPPDGQLEQLERVADGDDKTMDQRLLDGLPGGQPVGSAPRESTGSDPGPPSGGRILSPFSAGSDVWSEHPLRRIGKRMREVEQRLTQRDMTEPTQSAQRQIVAELGQLIDALASEQQGQTQRRAQSGGKQDQGTDRKTGQEAARDGTNSAQPANPADDSAESVRRAVGEIWGQLPERYRRHVQNAGAIEFLPQYRKLIEDYYRRLSEE